MEGTTPHSLSQRLNGHALNVKADFTPRIRHLIDAFNDFFLGAVDKMKDPHSLWKHIYEHLDLALNTIERPRYLPSNPTDNARTYRSISCDVRECIDRAKEHYNKLSKSKMKSEIGRFMLDIEQALGRSYTEFRQMAKPLGGVTDIDKLSLLIERRVKIIQSCLDHSKYKTWAAIGQETPDCTKLMRSYLDKLKSTSDSVGCDQLHEIALENKVKVQMWTVRCPTSARFPEYLQAIVVDCFNATADESISMDYRLDSTPKHITLDKPVKQSSPLSKVLQELDLHTKRYDVLCGLKKELKSNPKPTREQIIGMVRKALLAGLAHWAGNQKGNYKKLNSRLKFLSKCPEIGFDRTLMSLKQKQEAETIFGLFVDELLPFLTAAFPASIKKS